MSDSAFSDEYSEEYRRHEELDFLDRAALAAIHGDIAQGDFHFRTISEGVARAYDIAYAMLAERNRRRANRAK